MITGEYNECGYTIFSDGVEVYSAGNSPHDSQAHVAEGGLSLEKLCLYCNQTAQDIAAERGETVGPISLHADNAE